MLRNISQYSAKLKILEADSDLERKIIFYQGTEKRLISYYKLYGWGEGNHYSITLNKGF